MVRDLKKEFNFITNILVFILVVFGGFVWADTNGIWHLAKDIRSGIFGADEDGIGGGFSFISDVTFNADVNLNNVSNCAGKLITQANGTIYCGVDNVDDDDYVIGNEYPVAGTGISVTSNRTVNVDTSYVQRRVSSNCSAGSSIREINADGSVVCETDNSGGTLSCNVVTCSAPGDSLCTATCSAGYIMTGGGISHIGEDKVYWVQSYPSGNGWRCGIDDFSAVCYSRCCRIN